MPPTGGEHRDPVVAKLIVIKTAILTIIFVDFNDDPYVEKGIIIKLTIAIG
jgi:hypothetical protein